MGIEAKITAEINEAPFLTVFNALPDRTAIRLLNDMAKRFSGYAYDKLEAGIEQCAAALADDEGWRGDDLAARYLEEPWPNMGLAPVIEIAPGRIVA